MGVVGGECGGEVQEVESTESTEYEVLRSDPNDMRDHLKAPFIGHLHTQKSGRVPRQINELHSANVTVEMRSTAILPHTT